MEARLIESETSLENHGYKTLRYDGWIIALENINGFGVKFKAHIYEIEDDNYRDTCEVMLQRVATTETYTDEGHATMAAIKEIENF